MAASAYPLQWPEGWPRTPYPDQINTNRFSTTFDRAKRQLFEEMRLLKATDVVISSWLPLNRDGTPRADAARRKIEDPGVAVYFRLRGRDLVIARDAFMTVHDNLRSIGLSIEGLRQMERHGGAHMMDRAFTGFMAIEHRDWRKVMGFAPGERPGPNSLMIRWKQLAKERHPDSGGSEGQMSNLNVAYADARRELGLS